ncbi:hypothetical protein O181_000860 [Austropuccinia psidii MF-1]|uniref:Uncharacterized protein n=1 Tax=Austropuccinia psidii MF-1 TaxID=1389203 RepID=A0A9Q3B9U7_9BASI|nr:hypothetical protein [Austropuccinia psidii MF-1]
MEPTVIQAHYQKDKRVPHQKEGGKKGRSRIGFYQKATSQPTSPRSEEEVEETLFPQLQDSKDLKRCHRHWFQHGQNLDGIQGQRGA